ncbi:sperm-associated antigen 11B [Tamandua tetradactyla]|uniref:sperm-associated antigen 11B n=1 Tax=Tamandua tetradactyla TaxID=48850 RepID=UPI00405473E6
MKCLLPPFANLLLVFLLFPGLCRAKYVNHQSAKTPRESKEESPRQRTNESYLAPRQVKRSIYPAKYKFLPPRTPPFRGDIPPGIRNVICLIQHGNCRLFFCYSGEKKGDICSDPWNRCCIPNTVEVKKEKPETNGRLIGT